MIQINKSYNLVTAALDYRAMRQDMIGSNIANADTPFYKARDINFEDMLARKSAEIYGDKSNNLEMAKTSGAHLDFKDNIDPYKATSFFRAGHNARNDGNTVDIDVETTEMSKNSTMFNALVSAYKKQGMIIQSVLDASGKM